jgi:hypothetical protein
MSINVGRVSIKNNQNTIQALWEMVVLGFSELAPVGGTARFSPSGATGRITEHTLVQSALTVERDVSGALIAATDTITAPEAASVTGGTVASGTATTLTATPDPGWTTDEHAGRWVLLRGGESDAEWGRISSNNSDTLTVDANWTSNPVATDLFTIHEEQSSSHGGWLNNSPINWTTLGVDPNADPLLVQGRWFDLQSVAYQDQLVATVNLVLGDLDNIQYSIHRGTTQLGIPYLNPGDNQMAAVDRKAKELIGGALAGISRYVIGETGAPQYENGWGPPSDSRMKLTAIMFGRHAYLIGACRRAAGAPTPPSVITDLNLNFGFGPYADVYTPDGYFKLDSTGDLIYLAGPHDHAAISFIYFLYAGTVVPL